MELRPSLLLPAMLKAMTDTVLPAVDPENKLAVEQAKLVAGMLGLLASRLPLLARYDRTELRHSVVLAARVREAARGGPATASALGELDRTRAVAESALARTGADPSEIEAALLELRARIGAVVVAVSGDGDETSPRDLRRAVLDAAKGEVERARAWLLPQGWESGEGLPPLESLLDPLPEKGTPR